MIEPATLWQALRYGVKGAGATVANVVLMSIIAEGFGVEPKHAAIISTASLLVFGYVVMSKWVFSGAPSVNSVGGHLRRGGGYYAVILSGKALNYVIFVALMAADVIYPIAWILGSGVVFLATFSLNRKLWHGGVA